MTKQELIKRVATRATAVHRKEIGVVVDAVFAELAEYFVEARATTRGARGRGTAARFTYPGFGTFTKKRRGARGGRNPQTGAPITIPATTTVGFAPGQELKAALNEPPRRRRG
jgi:nucleoid DNA-binding protein